MKYFFILLCTFSFSLTAFNLVFAAKPAILYAEGGKFDKSFNEGVWRGAERFRKENGIKYREFAISSASESERYLRRFASRGSNPIVVIGFSQATAVKKVAPEYPDTKITLIDTVVDLNNVKAVSFKGQEGGFLAGALAALKTETGKIGFVGGMDIPLIRQFACGYAQGAKLIKEDIEIFQKMTGTTPAAWSNPTRGRELATSMYERGADIIWAAAGSTGLGVLQAAADHKKFAIGVDSNQNYLYPGFILSSVLKRVDLVTYNTLKDFQNGVWKPGVEILGLKEGGLDLAYDEHNENLISDEIKQKIAKLKADVSNGDILVHDYVETSSCPF